MTFDSNNGNFMYTDASQAPNWSWDSGGREGTVTESYGVNRFSPKRFFAQYLSEYNNVSFVRADSDAAVWRHACHQTGVNVVFPSVVGLPNGGFVKFHYCPHCRVLVYFMQEMF